MPSATIDSHGIASVAAAGRFLDDLLSRADHVKQSASIEPPLEESAFDNLRESLSDTLGYDTAAEEPADLKKAQRFAVIETAVRDTFKSLIATTPIESSEFVRVWNLLDVLSFLSDTELCDPALLFWLVEELLDSQTIAGCRKVFDFLESRRERITAKHFKQKQLVILRTCNELLRRLSRALDPAFCGRVFIFMFQSFPLGDKSSVNLRGEYHVENVTTFDQEPLPAADGDKMDGDKMDGDKMDGDKMDVDTADTKSQKDKPLDPDALYPTFWSLQESFNQPKKLFDPAHFAAFKAGLEATMATFRSIRPEQPSRAKEKQERPAEEMKPTLKRKRDDVDDELASGFNPKYLTSRDLFKLEISDLAFRRNILVQALIVMEFLLSLSPKAKEKLAAVKVPNKSVTYSDQQLSEDDTKWATEMNASIVDYLRQGVEGPYFNRMVETVLARDKNWVRWKIENCPSIELPTLSPETFVEARTAVTKLATTKRLRATPLGSLSLDFLDDEDDGGAMEKLKDPERYSTPELSSFKLGIADDDFEIEMPNSDESKAAAIEGKASKTWRALRIASRSKLVVFDKIDDDDKIDIVFEDKPTQETEAEEDASAEDAVFPDDRRTIVIVDKTSSPNSRSGLVKEFVAQSSRVFTKVPPHVTRKPEEGELNGQDYHFVDVQAFNVMRDGDLFLEFSDEGENVHGTNRKVVEGIMGNDRVPVMEVDHDGAQQVKDNGFDARFILIEAAAETAAETATQDLYGSVVTDLESLRAAVFGSEAAPETAPESAAAETTTAPEDGDMSMADGAAS
ncbi:THO complex subunit 1 transcription elongation factor-domain-containing protein [Staphylotrichum tortipilum]|uniref:THO complex subunit 1 transcription elongation factor-domain-containing protein n=1 Tax=Staphylotrichum tortipilum TaxID=2831512 RepID=A0AAN6RXJ5_9PEZI|nr:THO complex subunit 1 transcription elongation factor-domain-containing protein [Staphylotrichum longicolle]